MKKITLFYRIFFFYDVDGPPYLSPQDERNNKLIDHYIFDWGRGIGQLSTWRSSFLMCSLSITDKIAKTSRCIYFAKV